MCVLRGKGRHICCGILLRRRRFPTWMWIPCSLRRWCAIRVPAKRESSCITSPQASSGMLTVWTIMRGNNRKLAFHTWSHFCVDFACFCILYGAFVRRSNRWDRSVCFLVLWAVVLAAIRLLRIYRNKKSEKSENGECFFYCSVEFLTHSFLRGNRDILYHQEEEIHLLQLSLQPADKSSAEPAGQPGLVC